MTGVRAKAAILAFAMSLIASAALGDDARSKKGLAKDSDPELDMAASVAKKVDRDEAVWQDLAAKLAKAVEAYNPASIDLLPEGQSLDAFRKYCGKLLESGRNLVALHEKWGKASEGLADTLRKAPAFYRNASQVMKEKAESAKFAAIKERYLLAADIWEELAQKAERRAKDLGLDQNAKGVVDLVREENSFLEDFIKTLDALPRLSGEEGGRYGELLEVMRKHSQQSDELHRQLLHFRDKLKSGPKDDSSAK